ncbi:MAG: alpha/beta fold hydrolase [Verrucomicrobiota bacterium]|jgi:phospholipase/carboxylesterase
MLQSKFIPASAPAGRRLMIVLHGLGDSMEGWLWLPGALELPWLNFLLVNAPNPYYGGWAWYDIDSGAGVAASRELLFQLLDGLKDYPADQIVLCGFSQGCLMAVEVGARYPRRLAGIVGISGYVHEPEELLRELSPVARQQRFLLTHGTHDPMLPIQMTRRQVSLLQKGGLKIDWREFVKGHTVAGEEEMAVVRQFVRDCYAETAKE